MSQTNRSDDFQPEPDVDPKGRLVAEQLLLDNVCRAVDYRRTTESTNSLALADLAGSDLASPRCPKLFLADQQTAGRGRHGRRWVSSDETLTFSLVLPRPALHGGTAQIASLAVGLGIARFLEFEFAPVQVKLKWPNDVHFGGGKVAGILMETAATRVDRMVVGVGLNVGAVPPLDSDAETDSARGLAAVLGRTLERYDLLYGLVTHVLQSMQFAERNAAQTLDEFRGRCLLSGRPISFQEGGRTCQGRCLGISDQGALMVETDQGVRQLQSGEANLIRSRAAQTTKSQETN